MLNTVITAITTHLTSKSISAMRAYPAQSINRSSSYVVVSVSKGKFSPAGCGRYLGVYTNGGVSGEVFGNMAELEISMDIYAQTAAAALTTFDSVTESLADIPSGIKIKSFETEDTRYDEASEMFLRRTVLCCTACIVYEADTSGTVISDFKLRGEMNGYEC